MLGFRGARITSDEKACSGGLCIHVYVDGKTRRKGPGPRLGVGDLGYIRYVLSPSCVFVT